MKAAAIAALLGCSACSFIGVRGPDPDRPVTVSTCTSDRGLPIIDTVVAVAATVFVVGSHFAASGVEHDFFSQREINEFVGIVVGVPPALSALYGFFAVSRCRDARAAFR